MDLTQLANLGEFIGGIGGAVGAIAVLATLIYLAVQVRQSTDLAQAAAQREVSNAWQTNLDRISRDPRVIQEGLRRFGQMSNQDQIQFTLAVSPVMNHLDLVFRNFDRGLETKDNLQLYGDICLSVIREPGGREYWEQTKPFLFRKSREYLDERLRDESGLPPPLSDVLPCFRPDARAEPGARR